MKQSEIGLAVLIVIALFTVCMTALFLSYGTLERACITESMRPENCLRAVSVRTPQETRPNPPHPE